MQTDTKQQPRQQGGYQQRQQTSTAVSVVNPRLAYPLDLAREGIDERKWRVLIDSTFPAAKSIEAVRMALDYCRARNLDVFKKPVHIVPVWSSIQGREVETVWPGISELRTTAFRTQLYAGADETVFGEDQTRTFSGVDKQGKKIEETVTFPSWCRITVYRLVGGQRIAFPGPRVIWVETYAKRGRMDVPNDMWCKRPYGQIEKVAEAAALRKAFPEELGGEHAAEEMEGREVATGHFVAAPDPAAPRPTREQFTRPTGPVTDVDAEEVEPHDDIALQVDAEMRGAEQAQAATVGEIVDTLPNTTKGATEKARDWAAYGAGMRAKIDKCKSLADLDYVMAGKDGQHLAGYREAMPDDYADLMGHVAERQGIFAQDEA